MGMSIVGIIVALILAFIAFKVLTGLLKFGAIAAIIIVVIVLYSQGYLA
jgi:hypothetical protein